MLGNSPTVPVLRGRDPQLYAIGECLASTARGHGGVLLVEGPPGIGKSSLLAQARVMAARAGVRSLFGEAFESQQTVPFAPLLAATLESDPPIGDAEMMRSLGGQSDLRYWMLHHLHGELESAALGAPLAVVFDDLHWADAGTLVALSTLPRRLAAVPILWILAFGRGDGRAQVQDTITRLESDGARRLHLGALSDAEVTAVVADRLGAEPDAALLELAANARGNPFLLVELLEGLRDEDRLRTEHGRAVVVGDGLPRRLSDSMRERLDHLSDAARQAIQVASVLADRFSAEQLASMLQRRPSELMPALEEAVRADLFVEASNQLCFRHGLLRQAVRETLPRSLRRALQREAASVLLEGGAAPVEVARQLADSAEPGDREAIATLRKAARALAGSDTVAAADLSVRALELMPALDSERGPLVAETVGLLHSAARPNDAQALGERALAGALPPDQEAEVRLSLSRMFNASTVARANENRRALELPGLSPLLRARHRGWLAYNLGTSGHVAADVTPVAEAALADADAVDDLQTRVMATLGLLCVDGAHGRCARALERVEELRRLTRSAAPEPYLLIVDFHHANVLASLGRLDEALRIVDGCLARGRRERNAWLIETGAPFTSSVLLAAGRLADARTQAEASERMIERTAAGSFVAVPAMLTLAKLAIHTGDAKQLKAAVDTARRIHSSGSAAVRRHATWIMALAAMVRNDPKDAVRWLEDDEMPYAAPFLPADAGHQPVVARIALAAGDLELARRAVDVAESFDRESPGVPVFAATAAHTRGLVERDSAALVEAAAMLRSTERPLLFASAAEDAGRALARDGRTADAIRLLSEALDTYLECEATADARRASHRLRDLGVRRRVPSRERAESGWNSLTESELRVARLVAGGSTNRDAAERLFLSPHTVSSHLRSAFAKLEINSRIELARVAIEEDHMAVMAS